VCVGGGGGAERERRYLVLSLSPSLLHIIKL
jgi:hypothetical protein